MQKILIADDEPVVLKLLEQYLSSEGYAITTVTNGTEALDKLFDNKYDLIISDIMMPNLSGLVLLNLVRDLPIKVPIIFISSLDGGDIIKKSMKLGLDAFLQKPIDLKELSLKVKRLLPS